MQDLRDACERVGFPLPATAQQAETYLVAIAGLCLFRSEGIPGGAAAAGEIIGYNSITGQNYGGIDEPLPPGARAAFLLAERDWQAAPSRKRASTTPSILDKHPSRANENPAKPDDPHGEGGCLTAGIPLRFLPLRVILVYTVYSLQCS